MSSEKNLCSAVIFWLPPKLYFGLCRSYICYASYILTAVKVIFWLAPKLYFGFQPKLRYLSITCPRRKLRFWNHVIGGDNAHSYACLRLFPTGTQYPAGTPFLRSQWHKVCCTEGIEYRAFCNDIKCVARNCIKCVRNFCFCWFLRRNLAFFTTVANYFGFVCGF